MDVRLLFPNKYLGAPDLKGRDVVLTIHRIAQEELQIVGTSQTERKAVLFFSEMEGRPEDDKKRLVLNKTNAKLIAGIYGNETDEWTGKPITLYPTTCKFGRETVDCIRVRRDAPQVQDKDMEAAADAGAEAAGL